jgi:uncharacterized RDD family membrane protein YckC
MVWYYAESGQQRGPISDAELDEMIANGRASRETLVWRDGMENWQPLEEVRSVEVPTAPPHVAGELGASTQAPTAPYSASIVTPGVYSPGQQPGNPIAAASSAVSPAENCQNCGRSYPGTALRRFANLRVCEMCAPAVVQAVQQASPAAFAGVGASAQVRYGGFWIRAVAKSLDHFLISLMLMPLTSRILPADAPDRLIALTKITADPNELLKFITDMNSAILPYVITVSVIYNAVFVALLSATPGKMMCGLRVVSSDMSRVSFAQAIARAIIPGLIIMSDAFGLGEVAGFVMLVAYLMVAFDSQKRSLFDHICKTRVVRKVAA